MKLYWKIWIYGMIVMAISPFVFLAQPVWIAPLWGFLVGILPSFIKDTEAKPQ